MAYGFQLRSGTMGSSGKAMKSIYVVLSLYYGMECLMGSMLFMLHKAWTRSPKPIEDNVVRLLLVVAAVVLAVSIVEKVTYRFST